MSMNKHTDKHFHFYCIFFLCLRCLCVKCAHTHTLWEALQTVASACADVAPLLLRLLQLLLCIWFGWLSSFQVHELIWKTKSSKCWMWNALRMSMQQKNIQTSTTYCFWALDITYESCIFCICNELHTASARLACLLTHLLSCAHTIIHTQTNALIVYVFIHLKLSHITYSLSCIVSYRSRCLFLHWNRHTTINFFLFLLLVVVLLIFFSSLYSNSTWANS